MAADDTRTMAITHADFLRLLASLQPEGPPPEVRRGDGTLRIDYPWGEHRIGILLGAESAAPLGSLSLPQTRVRLDCGALGAAERERFLERFNRCFQRGGG